MLTLAAGVFSAGCGGSDSKALSQQIADHTKTIEDKAKEADKLFANFNDGKITYQEYVAATENIKKEILDIKAKVEALKK